MSVFGPAQRLPFSKPVFAWGNGNQLAVFDAAVPAAGEDQKEQKRQQQQPPKSSSPLVELVADRSIPLFQEVREPSPWLDLLGLRCVCVCVCGCVYVLWLMAMASGAHPHSLTFA